VLTRRQVLVRGSAGVAAGLAGTVLTPSSALSAEDVQASGEMQFRSRRPPFIALTVPGDWYVRTDVVQGMSVPWGLAFLSNEYVAWGSDTSGEWDDIVGSALTRRGAALALLALDRLVPASSWLLGNAPSVLANAKVDLGPSRPIGRPLSKGVQLQHLTGLYSAESSGIAESIGWFDQAHYLVAIQAWVGTEGPASTMDEILASIQA